MHINFLWQSLLGALDYKIRKIRRPLMVSLTLTNRCNLRCAYCYADAQFREPADYQVSELVRLIDDFISLGAQIFLLQGGEPLLYEDLRGVISHIKSRGKYCSMNTNGLLLHHRLKDIQGIDNLQISLDGSKELNDRHRGKQVYDKVIANLNLLRNEKIPFMFHTILGRDSTLENAVLPMVRLAKEYHTVVSLCHATKTGTKKNLSQEELAPVLEHYKQLAQEVLRLKREGCPIANSEYFYRHIMSWPLGINDIGTEENLPKHFKSIRCLSGRLTAWLDTDYQLYACPTGFFRADYGANIRSEGGLQAAWQSLSKIPCTDCLGIGECTPLFSLNSGALLSSLAYIGRKK